MRPLGGSGGSHRWPHPGLHGYRDLTTAHHVKCAEEERQGAREWFPRLFTAECVWTGRERLARRDTVIVEQSVTVAALPGCEGDTEVPCGLMS